MKSLLFLLTALIVQLAGSLPLSPQSVRSGPYEYILFYNACLMEFITTPNVKDRKCTPELTTAGQTAFPTWKEFTKHITSEVNYKKWQDMPKEWDERGPQANLKDTEAMKTANFIGMFDKRKLYAGFHRTYKTKKQPEKGSSQAGPSSQGAPGQEEQSTMSTERDGTPMTKIFTTFGDNMEASRQRFDLMVREGSISEAHMDVFEKAKAQTMDALDGIYQSRFIENIEWMSRDMKDYFATRTGTVNGERRLIDIREVEVSHYGRTFKVFDIDETIKASYNIESSKESLDSLEKQLDKALLGINTAGGSSDGGGTTSDRESGGTSSQSSDSPSSNSPSSASSSSGSSSSGSGSDSENSKENSPTKPPSDGSSGDFFQKGSTDSSSMKSDPGKELEQRFKEFQADYTNPEKTRFPDGAWHLEIILIVDQQRQRLADTAPRTPSARSSDNGGEACGSI